MNYDQVFSHLCRLVAFGFWAVVLVIFTAALIHLAFLT